MGRVSTEEFLNHNSKPGQKLYVPGEREELLKLGERILELEGKIRERGKESARDAFEMGEYLDRIKDQRMFMAKGYVRFSDYCKQELNMTVRHANKYIRIICNITREQAIQVGITKAILLSAGDPEMRYELIMGGKAEEMTTREVEKAVRKGRAVRVKRGGEIEFSMKAGKRMTAKFGTGGRAIIKLSGNVGVAVEIGDGGECIVEVINVDDAVADEPVRLPTVEATRMLLGEYKRRWKDRYGTEGRVTGPERASAEKMAKKYDIDTLFSMVEQYFTEDKMAEERGHPFWLFGKDYTIRRTIGKARKLGERAANRRADKRAHDLVFAEGEREYEAALKLDREAQEELELKGEK